jgi:hypothetical protein
MESAMAMNGVGGSALNVSPYLTSAMSRIQSGEAAKNSAKSPANASAAGQTGGNGTRSLSSQVMNTLLGMQEE